ncbi:pyruvate dehydrogenase E2 component (dihydrolipoamide acetyltransferase) [Sinobaca qinghaiensis]|uniref:Dihydrolipoamide acetyltransferase component of pyruvate dehydrogenase complex n=1 Tax=Sinobaca qinghaiensis TaxID=342944 RepID=A0A419V7G3_9BACL|nr:dihydrolipoamide acetyltransferase family protein [Sinobaca qinghaiensis]RKD75997.1 pyruvate dehydrogenase E2 component (dihydrolipoamide acetyltransferase) [Sinobaca qinghaiensis]
MAQEVVMPKFGMSMEEGTIVEWLVKPDDEVKKGDPLVTISSDKITNDLEAPASGVIIEVTANVDDTLPVGKTLAYIGEKGEKPEPGREEPQEEPQAQQAQSSSTQTEEEPKTNGRAASDSRHIKISPAAKKLAKSKNIPLEELTGTGPQGRITKQDVENYERPASEEPAPQTEIVPYAGIEEAVTKTPVRGMRKAIAENMHQSLQQSAQLTLMKKADVTDLLHVQKQAKQSLEKDGETVTLTLTSFIAKAVVKSLQAHSHMNSAYIEDTIHTYPHVHLGIAASLDNGLVVPVLFHAEHQSVLGLAESIQKLAEKARENRLDTSEMSGSTFTITNLGATGIEYFTPILNPPEAGILGIGSLQEEVVMIEGQPQARRFLPLSLTFDHRVIDGDPASRFLKDVASALEQPYQMLL